MKYCNKCVQPETRPGIFLNEEGVCSACVGHAEKMGEIDWTLRKEKLADILDRFRSNSHYDCLVPVSGGKDSTYQIYMMKRVFKMNPLAVTYRYSDRTDLGQENLNNLRKLGVDHIEYTPNPETERKFVKRALVESGDPCLPDHLGIFSVTLSTAVNFQIPLIIWGENPQLEYGGSADDRNSPYLDKAWLKKHGCLQEKFAEDWVNDELSLQDMYFYRLPEDCELKSAKIRSLFLGYYFKWDPVENYKIAKEVGFLKHPNGPQLGLYDFADLDSTNIVIHHYIKWLKFGMTRLNDNISVEIRNGRMTREEGVKILKENQERVPENEIDLLCDFIEMSKDEFWNIMGKFRNLEIWGKDNQGNWYIPSYLEDIS